MSFPIGHSAKCPYPIQGDDGSVKECVLNRHCGCVETDAVFKDAERYRKIKNGNSPFTVMYYGSRLLADGRNRTKSCELLTPELDEMIDSWPEEEHDV